MVSLLLLQHSLLLNQELLVQHLLLVHGHLLLYLLSGGRLLLLLLLPCRCHASIHLVLHQGDLVLHEEALALQVLMNQLLL